MRRKFILQLTYLLLLLFSFSLTGARAQTQNYKPIEISLNKNLKAIIGSSEPIWHLRVMSPRSNRRSGVEVPRSLEVILRPFRSSATLCRAYVIFMEVPNRLSGDHRGYGIGSAVYIALKKHGKVCGALSFKRDYFSVVPDSTDEYIMDAVKALRSVLSSWAPKHKTMACGGNEIGMSNLQSINLSPSGTEFSPSKDAADVVYRFACGNGKTSMNRWRQFEVWVNDDWLVQKYKTGLGWIR